MINFLKYWINIRERERGRESDLGGDGETAKHPSFKIETISQYNVYLCEQKEKEDLDGEAKEHEEENENKRSKNLRSKENEMSAS